MDLRENTFLNSSYQLTTVVENRCPFEGRVKIVKCKISFSSSRQLDGLFSKARFVHKTYNERQRPKPQSPSLIAQMTIIPPPWELLWGYHTHILRAWCFGW